MLVTLSTILLAADAAGKEPPREFRIFPMGEVKTSQGTFLFDAEAAKSVMAEYQKQGNELALDYEHAALQDPPPASGAPAAGWYSLELREDGLWAVNVRWTPRAADYLKNSEYRYHSPAFRADPKSRRIQRLGNVALTNMPATRAMTPLVAAKHEPLAGQENPTMKTLLIKLGLQETATEAEALAALHTRETEHEELTGELVALTGAKDLREAKGKLAALKQKSDAFDTAQAELVKLRATEAEREVTQLVDGGVREGKIPPALKAFWLEQGKKDLAQLRAYLSAAPKLSVVKDHKPADGEDGTMVMLTAEDKATAKMLAISHEDFLKAKQARAAQK